MTKGIKESIGEHEDDLIQDGLEVDCPKGDLYLENKTEKAEESSTGINQEEVEFESIVETNEMESNVSSMLHTTSEVNILYENVELDVSFDREDTVLDEKVFMGEHDEELEENVEIDVEENSETVEKEKSNNATDWLEENMPSESAATMSVEGIFLTDNFTEGTSSEGSISESAEIESTFVADFRNITAHLNDTDYNDNFYEANNASDWFVGDRPSEGEAILSVEGFFQTENYTEETSSEGIVNESSELPAYATSTSSTTTVATTSAPTSTPSTTSTSTTTETTTEPSTAVALPKSLQDPDSSAATTTLGHIVLAGSLVMILRN